MCKRNARCTKISCAFLSSLIISFSSQIFEWISWYKCNKPIPSRKKWEIRIDQWSCFMQTSTLYINIYGKLTLAKDLRSMKKNPLPVIEKSKLTICAKSSCLAKWSFSLSPAQNVSCSMCSINSFFFKNKREKILNEMNISAIRSLLLLEHCNGSKHSWNSQLQKHFPINWWPILWEVERNQNKNDWRFHSFHFNSPTTQRLWLT